MKFLTGPALGLLLCFAATTALAQEADLSVTLAAGPSASKPGDTITFSGTVTNNGPDESQLTAVINLPNGLTPQSISSNAGTLHSGYPTGVYVSGVTLAAGATFTLSTTAVLPPDAVPGTLLVGEIIATPTTPDPDTTNNNTTATITVASPTTPQRAELGISITDGSTTMAQGGQTAYVVTVYNNGPDVADATLSFPLPAALTFVSLSAPGGWTCATPAIGTNGTLTCNRSAMPVGSSAQFTVNTQLSASTAAGTQIVSTATVTSTSTDPYSGNNNATDINTIIAAPIAAVPTLTEWAMILFGTLLAGGAALHLQRRRRTA